MLNHALAGAVGAAVSAFLGPDVLRWLLGLTFLAMAAWVLIPDSGDDLKTHGGAMGAFGAALVSFFLAEMGDKTQVATVALAARFEALTAVIAGSTLGMMMANAPAVLLGERAAHRIPVRLVHGLAALMFAALGVLTLMGFGAGLYGA